LIPILVLSGCLAGPPPNPRQPAATVTHQDERAEESPKVPPTFESFFDTLKRSFTAEEVRVAADRFFQAHPTINQEVSPEEWPEIFRLAREGRNPPSRVDANVPYPGMWTLSVAYGGISANMRGIFVVPVTEAEVTNLWPWIPSEFFKWARWGQGVYVYSVSAPPFDPAQRRQKISADLESFLALVKASFKTQELREAADGFFAANPDFDGFLKGDQWPEMFKVRRDNLHFPTFIRVTNSNGRKEMMVEYKGSFWFQGICIRPTGESEVRNDPDSRSKYLKWEQGISVYLVLP